MMMCQGKTIHHVSIYTGGSKIKGRVGCAFTCWRNRCEVLTKAYRTEPFSNVYQSELLALRQAVRLLMDDSRKCDILSNTRSFLDALANPRSTHPLVNEVRSSLSQADEHSWQQARGRARQTSCSPQKNARGVRLTDSLCRTPTKRSIPRP